MVISAGDVRLDTKAIKAETGARVRMAKAEEVVAVTGYQPGGVCPFALENKVDIYLDESLKRYDVVYASAGTAHTSLPITFDELMEITGGKPCKFSA